MNERETPLFIRSVPRREWHTRGSMPSAAARLLIAVTAVLALTVLVRHAIAAAAVTSGTASAGTSPGGGPESGGSTGGGRKVPPSQSTKKGKQ
jgi:hypothetical protein